MSGHLPLLTACLLAGGMSSRMGRDKAGLMVFGKPLWQHQMETLKQLDAAESLISGRPDACYSAAGFPIIVDEFNNAGPLSGVASLLGAAKNSLVLVLAVDMPFMTAGYLVHLRNSCTATCGIVPELDGYFEGVSAIFPKSAQPLARELLSGTDHSMHNFISRCIAEGLMSSIPVGGNDRFLFQSLNTPGDVP